MPTPFTDRPLRPGEQLDLTEPPVVGSSLMVDTQTFIVVSVTPYTRRDGVLSSVILWQAACAGCKVALIQFKTGLRGRFADVRRCPKCIKKRRRFLYGRGMVPTRRKP